MLLNTISELRLKYSNLEIKQDELLLSMSKATQPLLRQIDSLQSSLKIKTNAWANQEAELTNKVSFLTSQLELVLEEKKVAVHDEVNKVAELNKELSVVSKSFVELKKELNSKSVIFY